MEPARRAPAPGSLRLVQAFVNSADLESGRDELAEPASAERYLARQGLLAAGVALDAGELERAVAVREALRVLLVRNNGVAVDGRPETVLNEAVAAAALHPRFEHDGRAELVPDGAGASAAVGRVLAAVHAAMGDGSWSRLKACRADDCRWAFFDHSKNRSGRWCTMAVCGSRSKVRAYRARRGAGPA